MSLIMRFLFLISLFSPFSMIDAGLYAYDFWQWRTIPYTTLTGDSTTPSSVVDITDCNATCATSATCFAYSVSVTADFECIHHPTRFGFGSTLYLAEYDYYEKPIGYASHDTFGTLLTNYKTGNISSKWPNTMQTYLSRYRDAVAAYVNISTSSTSKYDVIVVETNIASAEDCAALCTRGRGVIDEIGNRCISFNYHRTDKICHLLSFSYDTNDDHPFSLSDEWQYYERIIGDGCWITNPDCRGVDSSLESSFTGTFLMSDIGYEYLCMEQARYIHEDICDSYTDYATIAMYGSNGRGPFEAWNSWDLTTGCVIDLHGNGCPAHNNSRFVGAEIDMFRDTIGEFEFSAGESAELCFDRSVTWFNYCNITNSSSYIRLLYPDTDSVYYYPIPDCECDSYGSKYDVTTDIHYCTLNYTSDFCYRTKQADYWSAKDLLCADFADTDTGCVMIADSGSTDSTQCYLYSPRSEVTTEEDCLQDDHGIYCGFICKQDVIVWEYSPSIKEAYTLYSEISCDDFDGDCSEFTEDDCEVMAELIHQKCGNDVEDEDEQVYTYYQPTGKLSIYPPWEDPHISTIIRGITVDTSYTVDPDDEDIDLMSIRNGRWMSFTAQNDENMRQLDVWYANASTTSNNTLTLKLFLGYGVTDSEEVYETSTVIPADTDEGMVHFEFEPTPVMLLQSGETYTWLITSSSDTNKGYLGYVRGDGYSLGQADMAWDYIFVLWIEQETVTNSPLQALAVIADSVRPWFELWFGMGLGLLVIFCCFLCCLAWKRRHDEKTEKEEDRKFQAELKRRAQLMSNEEQRRKEQQVAWEKESVTAEDEGSTGVGDTKEEEEEDDIDMNATDTEEEEDEDDDEEDAVGGYGQGMDRVLSSSVKPMSSVSISVAHDSSAQGFGHAPLASQSVLMVRSTTPSGNISDGDEQKKKRRKKKKKGKSSKKKRKKKSGSKK